MRRQIRSGSLKGKLSIHPTTRKDRDLPYVVKLDIFSIAHFLNEPDSSRFTSEMAFSMIEVLATDELSSGYAVVLEDLRLE